MSDTKTVQEIREKTGAGILKIKQALTQANGNIEEAIIILRKQGERFAEGRSSKAANEGIIETYIHTGAKVAVMLELRCETDFVAKTEDFKSLARDLCLQIAATSPKYVSRENIDSKLIESEKSIHESTLIYKPKEVVERIVNGKLDKWFQEICLDEQAFVKDSNKTIKQLINEASARTGEKITVKRFVRWTLGE